VLLRSEVIAKNKQVMRARGDTQFGIKDGRKMMENLVGR
jgi:hypothetical protein